MICKRDGQTVVELLMILPVFMMMLFFVLELGNIAYNTIIVHHAAYEMARVGSMVAVQRPGGPTQKAIIEQKLREQVKQMFDGNTNNSLTFVVETEETSRDPQTGNKHVNEDLIVMVTYPVKLVFPLTSWLFADEPKRLGIRKLRADVRMPIERPLAI